MNSKPAQWTPCLVSLRASLQEIQRLDHGTLSVCLKEGFRAAKKTPGCEGFRTAKNSDEESGGRGDPHPKISGLSPYPTEYHHLAFPARTGGFSELL